MAKAATTWLIYPRRSFIICRILQVIISLTFLIVNFVAGFSATGDWYLLGLFSWNPYHCSAFLIYLSTLIAYLCNPTRLSRVLDPHNQNSRAPIPPLPNTPNLSRRGVTITIVVIEFLTVLFCLATFITGVTFSSIGDYDSCGSHYYRDRGYEGSAGTCRAWLWANMVLGNAVMEALGIMTFWQGVKVYRAGWRESCRKEVERERMESREPEGAIELRATPFDHGHNDGYAK